MEPTAPKDRDRVDHDDLVKRPSHYTRYDIEPIEFVMRNNLNFHQGNIVKYALRAGYKSYPGTSNQEAEIIDLEKVIRYAEMRISLLRGEEIL